MSTYFSVIFWCVCLFCNVHSAVLFNSISYTPLQTAVLFVIQWSNKLLFIFFRFFFSHMQFFSSIFKAISIFVNFFDWTNGQKIEIKSCIFWIEEKNKRSHSPHQIKIWNWIVYVKKWIQNSYFFVVVKRIEKIKKTNFERDHVIIHSVHSGIKFTICAKHKMQHQFFTHSQTHKHITVIYYRLYYTQSSVAIHWRSMRSKFPSSLTKKTHQMPVKNKHLFTHTHIDYDKIREKKKKKCRREKFK